MSNPDFASKDAPREPSQGRSTYQRLLDEISTGALRPGDRLTETDLAERMGLSRTPIREAIRQLEADGLVSHVARVGAVVRTLDYSEIMELYDMRVVLEGTAARMAARAASEIELSELDAINDEMIGAADQPTRAYDLNRQFHMALLDAAKNRFLVRSIKSLQKTLLILGPSTLEDGSRALVATEEHAALMEALHARDTDAAEARMRDHIQAAHAVRLRQLRSQSRRDDLTGPEPFND